MTNDAEMMAAGFKKAKPLTQKQVEDFIMLKAQSNERWFEVRFLDEDMNNDPTAAALMTSISDVIFAGMASLGLEERMADAEKSKKHLRGLQ